MKINNKKMIITIIAAFFLLIISYPVTALSTSGPTVTITTLSEVQDTEKPTWPSYASLVYTLSIESQDGYLFWTPANDNLGVVKYKVYDNDEEITKGFIESSGFSVFKPMDTAHKFRVEAYDGHGNKAADDLNFVYTNQNHDSEPPYWTMLPPEISVSNITSSSVQFSWPAGVDYTGTVNYLISMNGRFYTAVPGNQTTYKLEGLTANKEYTFKVDLIDDAGNMQHFIDPPSVTIKTVPNDTEAPVWIDKTIQVFNLTPTSLLLDWWGGAAKDNVIVAGYKILKNGVEVAQVPAKTYSYNISGLTAGTLYTFAIEAFDPAGNISKDGPQISIRTQEGKLQFDPILQMVNENAGTVTANVYRIGGSRGELSVNYSTVSRSAVGWKDFIGKTNQLTFANGETSKTIQINLINDSVKEQLETFSLILTGPSDVLGTETTTTFLIRDDD